MYTPQHIANYILERARKEDYNITPLKLNKLVYICYGWYLALIEHKLFDEDIQAWKHGPVIPSLYHEFKHFKRDPIDTLAEQFDLDTYDLTVPKIPAADQLTNLVLERVWDAYKDFSGATLRKKTHEADSPWSSVYQSGVRNIVIPDELIRPHFERRIQEYLAAAKHA